MMHIMPRTSRYHWWISALITINTFQAMGCTWSATTHLSLMWHEDYTSLLLKQIFLIFMNFIFLFSPAFIIISLLLRVRQLQRFYFRFNHQLIRYKNGTYVQLTSFTSRLQIFAFHVDWPAINAGTVRFAFVAVKVIIYKVIIHAWVVELLWEAVINAKTKIIARSAMKLDILHYQIRVVFA